MKFKRLKLFNLTFFFCIYNLLKVVFYNNMFIIYVLTIEK